MQGEEYWHSNNYVTGAILNKSDIKKEYLSLSNKTRLSLVHWSVLAASLVITLIAFSFSNKQVKEKEEKAFQREFDQVTQLVTERMRKYEDGLISGVACIQSHNGEVSYNQWLSFFNNTKIDKRYPGIHGIGLIISVDKSGIKDLERKAKSYFPNFKVYPEHDESEHWPIIYIEPMEENLEAIGLDMAHESNRFTALKKSIDTGTPQITGPIVLVQDEERTSGFLFFYPFYKGSQNTIEERQKNILGVVYAPFVVKKLMYGTLSQYNRHVNIKISDGQKIIYDEHSYDDSMPLYSRIESVNMYGRNWLFDVRTNPAFKSNKKYTFVILFGGIFIDIMLFLVFLTLTRSNKKTLRFAEKMSREATSKNSILEQRNNDLETLLHVTSHDLREPIRAVKNFSKMIKFKYKDLLDEKGKDLFFRIERGGQRMDLLLDDILSLSHAQRKKFEFEPLNCNDVVKDVLKDLENKISEKGATVEVSKKLPIIYGDRIWVRRAFFNLLSNSLKFVDKGKSPKVKIEPIYAEGRSGIRVLDQGVGIKEGLEEKIFELFQRGVSNRIEGTGAGLAIVKEVAFRHRGKVWVERRAGGGSIFNIVFLNKDLYGE